MDNRPVARGNDIARFEHDALYPMVAQILRAGHGYAEGSGCMASNRDITGCMDDLAMGRAVAGMRGLARVDPCGRVAPLAAYPALLLRIYFRMRRISRPRRDALYTPVIRSRKISRRSWAVRFYLDRCFGREAGRIDYKSA